MRQRLCILVLACTALWTATGCLDYEEVLTLNADGSGSVSIHLTMDKKVLNRMQGMAGPLAEEAGENPQESEEFCSEEEIRAALKAMGSGLELVTYKESDSEDRLTYDIAFKFGDYDDFRDLNDVCPDESPDRDEESQFDFSYAEQPDGSWLFTRRFVNMDDGTRDYSSPDDSGQTEGFEEEWSAGPDSAIAGEEAEEDLPEPVDMAKLAEALKGLGQALEGLDTSGRTATDSSAGTLSDAMMGITAGMEEMAKDAKNHKVRLVVNLPGAVVESNGTSVDGGTVTWEYTLDALGQAPRIATARVKR